MPSPRSTLAALLASLVALVLAIAPLTAKTASREKFSDTLEYRGGIASQLVEAAEENCLYAYDFASGDSLYNYFRDYNPATGRYQQSDPIGLWGGLNTYRYVSASPLDSIDANGLIRSTKRQKDETKAENKKFNCGRCEFCGVKMHPTQKPRKGVPRNPNEVNVDHINEQRFEDRLGCSNAPHDFRCLCAHCNQVTRNGGLFNTMR